MENYKKCKKCNITKPINEFYINKKMSDGYFSKCIVCTKDEVSSRYYENIKDKSYVEKERKRGREKYKRLNYSAIKSKHTEGSNSARHLKNMGFDLKNKEIHHWDYNKPKDIFILNRRFHKLVHRYITFDSETKLFKLNSDMSIIDTKKKHYELIMNIMKEKKINVEVVSYPEIDY